MYLTYILYVQCIQLNLYNDDYESNMRTTKYDLYTIYPIICAYHRLDSNNGNKNPTFSVYVWNSCLEHDGTTISDTQLRKNMKTMGKVDIADLMMITIELQIYFDHLSLDGSV